MVEQMQTKTMAELEIECLKVLKFDPHTRDIKRVGIVRLNLTGSRSELDIPRT